MVQLTADRQAGGHRRRGARRDAPVARVTRESTRRARSGRGLLLPALTALVVLVGLTVLLVSASSKPQLPGGASSTHGADFAGGVLSPRLPAPPLSTLRNYQGQRVNLASYRGKAVFVTFLYTHCPDACPLIAASLHAALTELGARARQVQLIAVSVDPRGDTLQTVAAFLHEHGLTGKTLYLIGSGSELAPVWSAWHVGAARDVGNPELVNHTALVYGVSASGKLTTIYPAGFSPSEIVHDVPGLLSS
jgi:protein SCO1